MITVEEEITITMSSQLSSSKDSVSSYNSNDDFMAGSLGDGAVPELSQWYQEMKEQGSKLENSSPRSISISLATELRSIEIPKNHISQRRGSLFSEIKRSEDTQRFISQRSAIS